MREAPVNPMNSTQPPPITLGISAKSADARTGQGFPGDFSAKLAAKVERHALLRMSQRLVYSPEKSADKQARVCWCHRTIVSTSNELGVHRANDGSSARFSGVATCGSVWHCPVCAAKITEARREELSRAMVAHVTAGGLAFLLTLTFPHEADHPLPELLEHFPKALRLFKSCAEYKRILGKNGTAGRIGSVRSLEVTIGQANGWHPHTHDLIFAGQYCFADAAIDANGNLSSPEIDRLKAAWVECLIKSGLGTTSKLAWMMEHALNVRGGQHAAEYIAKFGRDERWGASSEMTRPHAKVGTASIGGDALHFTPFQLLLWAANGDGWAAHRFREYAEAFTGKRMLSWSPRLKRILLGDDLEQSDEEIAAGPLVEESQVGAIDPEQFEVLLSRNKVGEFFRYVAQSCCDPTTAEQDIADYIDSLREQPETHGKTYRQRRVFASKEHGRYIVANEHRPVKKKRAGTPATKPVSAPSITE